MILPVANQHFQTPQCHSLEEHELHVEAHLATLRWMRAHVDTRTADALNEAVTAIDNARTVYWSTVWADAETLGRFQAHQELEGTETEAE